ncbi:hypothetical protein OPV22_023235 [Ensete ventricosum]|uniref:Glycosyltransferase 61 catalytic domain-containing protein n=1 Tax=Ensete ventricosum TaxID=4639 RepID=A0AAV8QQ69_ENSVE|nr:hypothetical protein OPV22_023235 [Ensete ventricosum]
MAAKFKMFRNAGQSQRFRFVVLVVGCFLVSMTFIVVSRPLVFPSLGSRLRPQKSDVEPKKAADSSSPFSAPFMREDEQTTRQSEKNAEENLQVKKNGAVADPIEEDKADIDEVLESTNETEEDRRKNDGNSDRDQPHNRMTLPTVSNYTINDNVQVENKTAPDQPVREIKDVEKKLSCEFSDPRVDICEMSGDIRIPGNSSDVIFVESPERNEVFRFRPYARKGDEAAANRVRELAVKYSTAAPECTVNHDVPAIVFSAGGYTGNLFHDFTDVLIPLFLTSRPFDGEVQFVVSDMNPWWIYKYLLVFQQLSKYPVIDFDKDKSVHCFSRVIVGLRAHKELSIDPARAPNGYSMVDFGKFIRNTLSLERETVSNIEDLAGKRPRILIIARKQSRAFVNLSEITRLAEQFGFEVVINDGEVGGDVAQLARLVNSVDVMVGVHGSGLTSLVFLPPNATIIQVVPWGGLEWISTLDFGDPAKDMGLNYVQYSISVKESTLRKQYPKNHPVFKDPLSFHKQGADVVRSTFMDKQNVKLDTKKFKNVLWKALEHIIQ